MTLIIEWRVVTTPKTGLNRDSPGPNFAKIKKRLGHSLTFTPERLYTKFQKIWLIRLGENALRTDGQTNGRTDGTEIIGPSGKIPGTN